MNRTTVDSERNHLPGKMLMANLKKICRSTFINLTLLEILRNIKQAGINLSQSCSIKVVKNDSQFALSFLKMICINLWQTAGSHKDSDEILCLNRDGCGNQALRIGNLISWDSYPSGFGASKMPTLKTVNAKPHPR